MHKTPNLALRDMLGLIAVLVLAVALVVTAFITHAGPFILIAILTLLIFGILRFFREQGRERETKEIAKALRTRLHKGEELVAFTIGDRRRIKPIATLTDLALMMFTQGLAAQGSSALETDDTIIGLTNQRLIAIDRYKRSPDKKRSWRERLNLARAATSAGKHVTIFEAPCDGVSLSVRLAVFYLARMNIRAADGRFFSIGLNSRFWAEKAVQLSSCKMDR